jgi:hypothetical protein
MRFQTNWQGVKSRFDRVYRQIDRMMRRYNKLAIGVGATLLIILLVKNFMYLPGICAQQPSITIVDESKQKEGLLIGRNSEPIPYSQNLPLQNYVATISKHFSTNMNKLGKCHYAELFFVYRPLVSDGIPPFNFEPNKFYGTRSLDSPWVKLTLSNYYKPIARAAFIWNERQFLLDQALLSGARTDLTKPLLPLDENNFIKFVNDYSDAVDAVFKPVENERQFYLKRERYGQTLANMAKRVPIDIMWQLRRSSMGSDLGGGPIRHKISYTIERKAIQYIDLSKALLNSRFRSVQSKQSYQSILDLKDIFNINKYRIE